MAVRSDICRLLNLYQNSFQIKQISLMNLNEFRKYFIVFFFFGYCFTIERMIQNKWYDAITSHLWRKMYIFLLYVE